MDHGAGETSGLSLQAFRRRAGTRLSRGCCTVYVYGDASKAGAQWVARDLR